MHSLTHPPTQGSGNTSRSSLIPYLRKFPFVIILYMGFVLPLGTFTLSPEIAPEHQMAHYRHMFMYGVASMAITFVWVVICYSFVCRQGCGPSEAFAWKVAGAVMSPLILIGCNVLLPWLTADELPDVYTGYLIGRLCFLMALSMLFCLGMTGDVAEKQYDEGLVQLRMAWAAFALLFASDPILTRYLYAIPQQGEMLHGQLQELSNRLQSVQEQIQGLHEQVQALQIKLKEVQTRKIPQNIILALVHLNFCGGVTLLILPLWKLSKLRGAIKENINGAAGGGAPEGSIEVTP